MSSRTILVVDDDHAIRESLLDVLTDEGYQVAVAADGVEGLRYLRTHERPALILFDWMMPRCDGEQFRRAVADEPSWDDIPLVLLTADARARQKAADLDVAGHINKPVPVDHLLTVISDLIAA
jgi:CheY-like chemotaxis protein